MKVLKVIGIIVGALIVIAVGVVVMQPAQGHVEKSVVINAPAGSIFPYLNNLEKFVTWSPWSKMDPTAKNTFEGAPAGVGSKMRWDGPKTGKGAQWITESLENERVNTGLQFEGMEGESSAEFVLTPTENGTKVTWKYAGENIGFTGKAVWMVMGGLLEAQYQDGLNDLKKMVESQPVPHKAIPSDSTEVQ